MPAEAGGNERLTSVGWLATFSLLPRVHKTPFEDAFVSAPINETDAITHIAVATAAAPQVSDDI
jgi:hypothetical protein